MQGSSGVTITSGAEKSVFVWCIFLIIFHFLLNVGAATKTAAKSTGEFNVRRGKEEKTKITKSKFQLCKLYVDDAVRLLYISKSLKLAHINYFDPCISS